MSLPDSNGDASASTRRVVVDDTNAQIQYIGPWHVDTRGSQDGLGNFGPTFRGTLHGVISSVASFSLLYEGSASRVYGTLLAGSQSGVLDPSWGCFVDGESYPVPPVMPADQNNWRLCDFDSLQEGVHNITILVTSRSRHFWLDYITYNPSPNPIVRSPVEFARIENQDRAIRYDASWRPLAEMAYYTATPEASMAITFAGTSIAWYGVIPAEMSNGSAIAMYSIDGSGFVPFDIPSRSSTREPTMYNQPFFTTPTLSEGTHTLNVTYMGDRDLAPLVLDYLIIHNARAANNPQTISIATPTAVPETSAAASAGPSGGTIAGAVIGSLLLFALLIAGFIFGRRWHRKRCRPTIQPLPGFGASDQPRAPLDIDAPQRYSVELEERMQNYGTPFPAHLRTPRRNTRVFNPEIRSTIDFDQPPVQNATMGIPGWGIERERDSMFSTPDTTNKPPTPPLKDVNVIPKSRSPGMRTVSNPDQSRLSIGEAGSTSRTNLVASEPQVAAEPDPYRDQAGYPYATNAPGLTGYEQLVFATKAEEAERERRRKNTKGRHHRT